MSRRSLSSTSSVGTPVVGSKITRLPPLLLMPQVGAVEIITLSSRNHCGLWMLTLLLLLRPTLADLLEDIEVGFRAAKFLERLHGDVKDAAQFETPCEPVVQPAVAVAEEIGFRQDDADPAANSQEFMGPLQEDEPDLQVGVLV